MSHYSMGHLSLQYGTSIYTACDIYICSTGHIYIQYGASLIAVWDIYEFSWRHQDRKHARSAHKVIRGSETCVQYLTKSRVLRMWAGLNSGRSEHASRLRPMHAILAEAALDGAREIAQGIFQNAAWILSVGRKTWATDIKYILYFNGFGDAWQNQGVGNDKLFIKLFEQRIIDIEPRCAGKCTALRNVGV